MSWSRSNPSHAEATLLHLESFLRTPWTLLLYPPNLITPGCQTWRTRRGWSLKMMTNTARCTVKCPSQWVVERRSRPEWHGSTASASSRDSSWYTAGIGIPGLDTTERAGLGEQQTDFLLQGYVWSPQKWLGQHGRLLLSFLISFYTFPLCFLTFCAVDSLFLLQFLNHTIRHMSHRDLQKLKNTILSRGEKGGNVASWFWTCFPPSSETHMSRSSCTRDIFLCCTELKAHCWNQGFYELSGWKVHELQAVERWQF